MPLEPGLDIRALRRYFIWSGLLRHNQRQAHVCGG